jgi:methyl-accepting chemotaxis protein
MVSNYVISTKVGAAFAVLIVLLIVGTTTTLYRTQALQDQVSEIINQRVVNSDLSQSVEKHVTTLAAEVQTALLSNAGESAALELAATHALAEKTMHTFNAELPKMGGGAEERELAARLVNQGATFEKGFDRVIGLLKTQDWGALSEAAEALNAAKKPYAQSLERFQEMQRKAGQRTYADAVRSQGLSTFLLIALNVVFIILLIDIAYWIIRNVSQQIHLAASVANRVASGDLTVRITSTRRDEIGWLFHELSQMSDNLQRMAGSVRDGAHTIVASLQRISGGADNLSQRAEAQASTLEETVASLEELSTAVAQNLDNAREVGRVTNQASAASLQSNEVVDRVVSTMNNIRESSRRIGDINTVIDGIAFQTNILALNAAVEAARAGDQGRGFAVVAQEVRGLAQRCAQAAKEIKSLIDESSRQVAQGGELAQQARTSMQETVAGVRRVADIMDEVIAASQEQTSGIQQVNQAVVHMDNVTQQNATLAAETADNVKRVEDEARRLSDLTGGFKLSSEAARSIHRASAAAERAESAPAPEPEPRRLVAKRAAPATKTASAAAEEWTEF